MLIDLQLIDVFNLIYFCFFWLMVLLGNGYKDNKEVKRIPTIAGYFLLALNNLLFYLLAAGLYLSDLPLIIIFVFVFKVINALTVIFVSNRIFHNSKIKWGIVFVWSILFELIGLPSYVGVIGLLVIRYIREILYVIRRFFMVC